MGTLHLQATTTETWRELICEAEQTCSTELHEDLQSYLVFMLMRFMRDPQIVSSILAMDFLQALEISGQQRQDRLRDVGDKCLIFSGLFPGIAEKRLVRLGYFVKLGQSAYSSLSEAHDEGLSDLFSSLCQCFVPLMEVLQATRELDGCSSILQPLQAEALWRDTGSPRALSHLKQYCRQEVIFMETNKNNDMH